MLNNIQIKIHSNEHNGNMRGDRVLELIWLACGSTTDKKKVPI